MAQVLFAAVDRAKFVSRSDVLFTRQDQEKAKLNEQEFGITATSLQNLVRESDVLILCVRPQQAAKVLRLEMFWGGKMLVSVLGGTRIATLEGCGAKVIRTMPNLCSSVGEGMTVLSYGAHCEQEFKSFVKGFFGAAGEVAVVAESLMDIACGMAGSGPGFIFRLIDAMARSGERRGDGSRSCFENCCASICWGCEDDFTRGKS